MVTLYNVLSGAKVVGDVEEGSRSGEGNEGSRGQAIRAQAESGMV